MKGHQLHKRWRKVSSSGSERGSLISVDIIAAGDMVDPFLKVGLCLGVLACKKWLQHSAQSPMSRVCSEYL